MIFRPRLFVGCLVLFLLICLPLAFIFFTEDIPKEIPDDSENLHHIPYSIITKSENPVNVSAEDIALVIVLSEGVGRDFYRISIDSVECYAMTRGYKFILTLDTNWGCDHLKDKFFRRHCVISKILPDYQVIVQLDADIGVVNPEKRIEDFLDERIDITFYDRHFSPEIAMGSYIIRNTKYAMDLIREFSNYETQLPDSFHGFDNGAIHMFLAEKLFPNDHLELELCRKAWKNSQNVADQFAYTSCIRNILGKGTDFGRIRILKKGTGHVRDDWLTSGIWSPERDFMLHGWKMKQLKETPRRPLEAVAMSNAVWYNPFRGEFELSKCVLGNFTWNHNPILIGSRVEVEYGLRKTEVLTAIKKIQFLEKLSNLIQNK